MIYKFNTRDDFIRNIRLHILYCLIYGLSILAGLWQHGHPVYTCVLLGIVFPVMLFPFFGLFRNELSRSIVQMVFPLMAGVWLFYRILNRIPSDRFLVESLALAGFAFCFTLCKKDRSYFLLIASILLIYGAVYPRAIFLNLIPIIMFMILLTFYLSRTNALCQEIDIPESKAVSRFSWLYLIPHIALLITIAVVIFMFLPIRDYTSAGYFSSNISNDNLNYSPPLIQEWFKTKQRAHGNTGKILTKGGKEVDTIVKQSDQIVPGSSTDKSLSANGNGSGPPGNDLLFTVASEEKLYWLVNLYDEYDGTKWKITPKMSSQRLRQKWDFLKVFFTVQQKFKIKKWHSRALPSAFMPTYFSFYGMKGINIEKTFFSRKFAVDSNYPELPFIYTVQSYMPNMKVTSADKPQLWWEKLAKKHYIQLPKNKISFRVRRKAKEITFGINSDYEKALAIRDYLRGNFKYEQFSGQVPEGKEAVDYFVFELKKGHCEYFASAMVTLARLNGLPARLATGFSPGNYNLITSEFEVYEYHAHAWAQIFIDNKGWLTFDATPPGNIISRTTPLGIGTLKDPFGDEWRINPPELASKVQKNAISLEFNDRKTALEQLKAENIQKSQLHQFLMQIPSDGQELQDSFKQVKQQVAGKSSFLAKCYASFKANFTAFINSIVATMQGIAMFFCGLNGCIFILIIVLSYPGFLLIRKIILGIRNFIKRKKCEEMFDNAVESLSSAPDLCIELCYFATRNLLEISGYGNKQKLELFDYGISLKEVDLQLSKDALAVFYIYTQMSYSMKVPQITDSEQALVRSLNIRSQLNSIR